MPDEQVSLRSVAMSYKRLKQQERQRPTAGTERQQLAQKRREDAAWMRSRALAEGRAGPAQGGPGISRGRLTQTAPCSAACLAAVVIRALAITTLRPSSTSSPLSFCWLTFRGNHRSYHSLQLHHLPYKGLLLEWYCDWIRT